MRQIAKSRLHLLLGLLVIAGVAGAICFALRPEGAGPEANPSKAVEVALNQAERALRIKPRLPSYLPPDAGQVPEIVLNKDESGKPYLLTIIYYRLDGKGVLRIYESPIIGSIISMSNREQIEIAGVNVFLAFMRGGLQNEALAEFELENIGFSVELFSSTSANRDELRQELTRIVYSIIQQ